MERVSSQQLAMMPIEFKLNGQTVVGRPDEKIIETANRRSGEIIDEARSTAISEGQRLVGDARQEVALEQARARDSLRKDVASLAVAGASRLLGREIDARVHADLIEQLAREIETAKA